MGIGLGFPSALLSCEKGTIEMESASLEEEEVVDAKDSESLVGLGVGGL